MSNTTSPKRRMLLVVFSWIAAILIAFAVGGAVVVAKVSQRHQARQRAFENKQFADAVAQVDSGASDRLSLYDMHGIDEKFSQLQPSPGLVAVHLSLTDITEAGLRSLTKHPNLKQLAFGEGRNWLHLAEFQAIAELTQLEHLAFDGWCILDEQAVGSLKTLPHLEYLEITHFASAGEPDCVTDGTLQQLTDFKQLKSLKLKGNWFSEAAVSKLREELPDCQIVVEFVPEISVKN